MNAGERITAVESVPEESTFLFTVRAVDDDAEKEAILVRLAPAAGEGAADAAGTDPPIACWLNYCQHFTHITLDKGSGAEMRDGEVICTNHGAYFESDSGLCTYGPCEGAYLEAIEVTVRDGDVYLTDDGYAFGAVGPAETDDLDLASKSNYEF
jgi:nitrite reductase/ring-hydroxylating ferredoxin subunit